MTALPCPARMTADEFIVWVMERPEGAPSHELVAGEVVAVAPERAAHVTVKARVWRALDDAVTRAGLSREAFIGGVAVEVDGHTVHEPDALKVTDPVVVVEVLSPSTQARDTGIKLADYFRVPTVRHYLIVDPADRTVVHRRREEPGERGRAVARTFRGGRAVVLDPPGLALEAGDFFP